MSIINKIKINDIIYDIRDNSIQNKIYSSNEEPVEAKPGDIWIDMDEESGSGIEIDTSLSIEGAAADAKAVGEALAEKQPVGDYATEDYVDSAISAIPIPDVSGQISEHNTDVNAHTDLRDAVAANEAAISVLLNGTDSETIDGVNDLINYVNEHGSEVTGIKADIKENADNIEQLNTLVGNTKVSEQISTAISTIKVPTRSAVVNPTDQSVVTYFKISNFGTWHGLATNEKVSLLIGTRSGETILFTLAGENATTMGASALRLNDRYSKISEIYYKISENAIYVSLAAWGNILSVDVLSDKSGNYTPIVEQIDALPTDATDAAEDAKLIAVPIIPFGSHYSTGIVVGNTTQNLTFGGKNTRPTYNDSNMALMSDITPIDVRLTALEASAIGILSGTEEPTSSIGEDGDIYLMTD